ncbi:AraC family transcriptional regulator [uncultured Croceitalea sp.]|uniref:helix-turn-helix domain-containing protein n=1 Tax=uncultured Croceitalea sp. TaxID=1798908 RepID=UPI003305979A
MSLQAKRYQNSYYDHFSKAHTEKPPIFDKDQNYMMRFTTPLLNYRFDDSNLSIVFFNQGGGEFNCGGRRLKIEDHKFIVINPSKGWEYVNHAGGGIDVLSIVLCDDFRGQFNYFNRAASEELLDDPFGMSSDRVTFFEQALRAVDYRSGRLLKQIYDLSNGNEYALSCAEELSMEILAMLHADQFKAYKMANKIKAKKKSTREETLKRLLVAYEFINDNLTESISLQDLALASSLSKYHLFESFKVVFGKSPHQLINTVKVKKSVEYLQAGYSVSEVSQMLGFTDLPVFSKVFKKIYKYPPSQFQQAK